MSPIRLVYQTYLREEKSTDLGLMQRCKVGTVAKANKKPSKFGKKKALTF